MTYAVHPGAEKDIGDAADFYKERAGAQVAQRFLGEFERVAKLLVRIPHAGAQVAVGRRAFHLKLFPYTVVYRILPDGVQILVVRHQHRKPDFGMNRG